MLEEQRIPQDDVNGSLLLRAAQPDAVDPYLAARRRAYGFTQTRIPASMNTIDPKHYGGSPAAGRQIWPLLPPFIERYDQAVMHDQFYGPGDLLQIVRYGAQGILDRVSAGAQDVVERARQDLRSLLGRAPDSIATLAELDEHLRGLYAHDQFRFIGTPGLRHWLLDDEEYGRQRLGGVNPTLLAAWRRSEQELSKLTQGLPAEAAEALRIAANESRLFFVDYRSRLSCITYRVEGEYLAVQTIALFVRKADKLLPAAIRLEDDGPWFTPEDGFAWLLAKMHANTAETQDQGTRAHLLCTHLLHETYAIAMERAFSENHPLRLLLSPHLRYTITINELARKLMVDAGGNIDRVNSGGRMAALQQINYAYRRLRFGELALPADIAARGVDAAALPVSYPYRDDGLAMWDAILCLCTDIVNVFYPTDADIALDSELRGFTEELSAELNRGAQEAPDLFDSGALFEGRFERFPARLSTRTELAEVLCNMIFGSAFQHAAVNNPQFDFYGYIPGGTLLLRRPPPRSKDITAGDILAALPTQSQALFQSTFMHQLVSPSKNTLLRPDGDNVAYLQRLYGFRNPKAKSALQAHARRLEQARKDLLARQGQRQRAYLAEHPDCTPDDVPRSVAYPYLDPTLVDNDIQI